METAIAKILWARSEQLGFRYTTVLSDGDSKTIDALNELSPYGETTPIIKEECINHVSKRMYKGLKLISRNAMAAARAEGKTRNPVSGQGKMTKARMKSWSSYYRKAIIENSESVDDMKSAIWAIFFHSMSDSNNPHHDRCSVAWCFFKQATEQGIDPEEFRARKKHDTPLSKEVAYYFIDLFKHLTNEELLKRCQKKTNTKR
ncbi:hypothetical protein SNE40_005946 [Patella caerulea]|uniref:Mutator-like transposase domain-containing protein n=1 Tax=Patella caerulea TaxID=87958 RepID=A0AAN8QAL9_PATCE